MSEAPAVPSKLMVIIPGLRDSTMRSVVDRVRRERGDYRVEFVPHGIKVFSRTRTLAKSVAELAHKIRGLSGENTGEVVDEVVLVGHSLGGILIRAAYLYGLGYDRDSEDGTADAWPRSVKRIVLLGSPNAGYREKNLPGGWVYPLVAGLGDFALEAVHSGAYWLANLRLRWLEVMRKLYTDHEADPENAIEPPLVVQVYGAQDGLVTREDIDDSRFMPRTVRTEISSGDHGKMVDLTDADNGAKRWDELAHALFDHFPEADDFTPVSQERVYFILHGIRASAYDRWVGDLTDALQPGQAHIPDPDDRLPKVYSLNYKFFSAIEFAVRGTRQKNIHQFLDQYMEAVLSHDPDGFSFMGHSNGTYMMATVMQHVRAVRFRNIMLAGSVLPSDFDWRRLFENGQIGGYTAEGGWRPGKVHNDRARVDVPVGILANGLRLLGYRDIGAGGYRGFEGVTASGVTYHRAAFPKGHGAALVDHDGYPERMPEIARFLVDGEVCTEPQEPASRGFSYLSRIAWFVVLVGLIVIVGLLGAGTWLLSLAIGAWALLVLAVVLLLIYVGLRSV